MRVSAGHWVAIHGDLSEKLQNFVGSISRWRESEKLFAISVNKVRLGLLSHEHLKHATQNSTESFSPFIPFSFEQEACG
jgi:hypothetical protein